MDASGGDGVRGLRYAAALGFVGFVTSFGAHVVAVNLPFYAAEVGIGVALIGVLIAVYDFAEIIGKPLFGVIADRQGMKRTMLAGIGLFVAASLVYLVVPPELLIVVRLLQGAGAAALSACSLALVAIYYRERRGRAYGVYNAMKGAGYVLSPIVGGLLVAKSGFSTIFIATAAIGAVGFLVALALPREPAGSAGAEVLEEDDELSFADFRAIFTRPDLLRWYAVIVVNMFFVGILFGFLPVRIHALGYGAVTSGVLLAVVALGYLVIQPFAGVAAERRGPAGTIRVGLVVSALMLIVLAFASGALFVVAAVLAGFGIGIVWTNTDTLISQLARSGQLAATIGAAGSFKELGDMLGPVTIGLLAQALGLSAGFVICGVLGLAAVMVVRTPRLT